MIQIVVKVESFLVFFLNKFLVVIKSIKILTIKLHYAINSTLCHNQSSSKTVDYDLQRCIINDDICTFALQLQVKFFRL